MIQFPSPIDVDLQWLRTPLYLLAITTRDERVYLTSVTARPNPGLFLCLGYGILQILNEKPLDKQFNVSSR